MTARPPPPDPVYTLRGVGNPITALKFQTDESLYSGDSKGSIHTWDMKIRRISSTLRAHPGHSVLWMDFTQTGTLLTQGRDGWVKVWSPNEARWTETGTVKSTSLGFCGACLLNTQNLIASPSDAQSQVDILDLNSNKLVSSLKPDIGDKPLGMCMKIRVSQTPDAADILIGYEDGSVALWDLRTNKMVDRVKVHEESVMCMDFNSEIKRGFSGSVDQNLVSLDIEDDKIKIGCKVTVKNPGFNDIVTRKDGKIVVAAGWDSQIRIFGCKKLKPLAILSYHKESVHCITFSPNNILACGSKDQHISLWDIYR